MAKTKHFKHLHVPDHWEQYWSRYPQGYTILEALINWVSQVDDMVDNVNDWNTYLHEFVDTFDTHLQEHVANTIRELHSSGILAEIIQGEVFDNIILRIEAAEDISNEAKALATNPLAALTQAGYKIRPEDLSNEVVAMMTEQGELQQPIGYYEVNRGAMFPLKNITRDGEIHNVTERVKNAILDVRVIGAKRGKMYAISYISNGFNGSYGFTIKEYSTTKFATDSSSTERQLIDYRDGVMATLGKPFGVTTRVFDIDGMTFVVTIDYTDIPEDGGINLSNTPTGQAYGAVIDHTNYVYRDPYPLSNMGIDYPLLNSKHRGETGEISQLAKNAILDVKVFGAKVDRVYRLVMVANGFESQGKKRYGITLLEFRKDDYEETGYRTENVFEYNNDDNVNNSGNANYEPKSTGIDTITVDNGEIACSVTVDRRLIGEFINLNTHAPTAMINPTNYFF